MDCVVVVPSSSNAELVSCSNWLQRKGSEEEFNEWKRDHVRNIFEKAKMVEEEITGPQFWRNNT